MEKKKILINKEIIVYVVLLFYFYSSKVAKFTIYENASIFLLFLLTLVIVIKERKISIKSYFYIYIFFVLYQLFLIISGFAIESVTLNVIKTMIYNFEILFCIYNIVIYNNNMTKVLKCYITSSFLSLSTVMFLLRSSLFTGRLGHAYGTDAVSFYFLGNPISMSSNEIAFYCATAVILALYIWNQERKNSYLFVALFLIIGVFLTGSRKGILILAFYLLFIINIFYRKKILKKGVIAGLIILCMAVLMAKVPALYNIIGKRLINLFNSFLGKDTNDSSLIARAMYREYALDILHQQNIFFGNGIGYFKSIYGNNTESNFLEMLISGGVIGFFMYYLNAFVIFIEYIMEKKKTTLINLLFFILLTILFAEYGSVLYLSRTYLVFIVIYLACLKLNKKCYS